MNKQTLKTVLESIVSGDTIDVTFAGEKTVLSGSYKVLYSKIGRGKCGSRLASIQSMQDQSITSIGTKENDMIVNIVHNGQKYGFESMTEGNIAVNKNLEKAATIKEKLKHLVGFGGRQINITSSQEPELNGSFTLRSAELSKGRFGQLVLKLTNNTTNKNVEFWSYRHSGLIDTIEVEG
jgi:hypothetical protein